MKKIRLEASGSFGNLTSNNDRDAMLVYAGKFDSMDGPVEVTADAIKKLVESHNAKLSGLGREPKMKDYPPIMLDHSNSAKDVVGRLVGPLVQGEHEGQPAIFGKVRILGKENVEKVEDGRWTHLSIGADLDTGTMHELTITPFPAAANAALLSQEASMARNKKKLSDGDAPKGITSGEPKDEKLSGEEDDEAKKLGCEDKPGEKLNDDKPKDELNNDEPKDGDKLSDDKDADDKLSDDNDADDKLSDEEKDDKELSQLSSGFRSKAAALKLSLRKQNISARLSALQAEAKITPAERKKIDLSRLASASDATVEAVLETYKARQPVIHTGVFGTIKAETAAQLAARLKIKEMTKLEAESRSRFTSLGKKGQAKLNGMPTDESTVGMDKKPVEEVQNMSDDESDFDQFARMIREGRDEEAKEMFKKMTATASEPQPNAGAVAEMSALQATFDELVGEFDSFVKLATKRRGVKL